MSALRLRPVRPDDEAAFVPAHRRMLVEDGFELALGLDRFTSFAEYADAWRRWSRGVDLPDDYVRATLLVAEVGGAVVGRSSIRFELNDWLAAYGGHIGYGVLPDHRRRGYATEILQQSLVVARAGGVERVLVTCSDDNVGSVAVIERCGGVLEAVVPDDHGSPMRRYWID